MIYSFKLHHFPEKLLAVYIYIYIYIYIQKLKSQKLDVLEWILNKKTHFKSSQIFRLFYITFYSVCQPKYLWRFIFGVQRKESWILLFFWILIENQCATDEYPHKYRGAKNLLLLRFLNELRKYLNLWYTYVNAYTICPKLILVLTLDCKVSICCCLPLHPACSLSRAWKEGCSPTSLVSTWKEKKKKPFS